MTQAELQYQQDYRDGYQRGMDHCRTVIKACQDGLGVTEGFTVAHRLIGARMNTVDALKALASHQGRIAREAPTSTARH